MKSMTGYAMLEKESAETQAIIEIKGYNSRYLDISLTLPSPLYVFEQEIRHLAGEFCRRGKIDLTVHLRKKNNFPLRINYTALDTYIKLYGEAAAHTAEFPFINKEINIQDLIHCEGVLEEGQPVSEDLDWPWLRTLIVQTFEQFNIERGREGAHTEAMILTYIAELESAHKTIAEYLPHVETLIKTNITKRFKELDIEEIDEKRILSEIALLLMKWTIAEELSRLEGHLIEFRAESERNVCPGKKLDFLCQEIAREINTIGAKTPLLEVSRLVVSMKEAVETIREQLRNIE